MKLLTHDAGRCELQFSTQEKDLLLGLLPQYPKLPADHHQASRNGDANAEVQKLLADALAEQRETNRAAAQAFLATTARFEPDADVWRLSLTDAEVEWLLQVLNDLRVGSWLALGSPGQDEDGSYLDFEHVTAENVNDLWTMEICGALEYELLSVLHGESSNDQ
jgi:hypothetical protein